MTAANSATSVLPPFGGPADQIVAVVTGILLIVGNLYLFRPPPAPAGFSREGDCSAGFSFSPVAWFVVYDDPPDPLPYFPLLLTSNDHVGWLAPGTDARVCATVFRSTWNKRSLWMRVDVDVPDGFVGWISSGRDTLASFLERQRSSSVAG